MSLADYLAKKYLNADNSSLKRKKRKNEPRGDVTSVVVEDLDDVLTGNKELSDDELDDDNIPITQPSKRSKGWKKVTVDGTDNRGSASNDVKLEHDSDNDIKSEHLDIRMQSGAKAGLQTGEQIARDIDRKQKERITDADVTQSSETIYRDASGRRVDLSIRRAEAQKKLQEEQDEEKRQKQLNLGEIQRLENEQQLKKLASMKNKSINVSVEDKELNRQRRDRVLFNDPAAKFLPALKHEKTSKSGRKVYQGSYAPNRFDIPPGYRWDGVDRSNGFEALWFQKQNEKRDKKMISYAMEIDD